MVAWARTPAEGPVRAWAAKLVVFLKSNEAFEKYLPPEASTWTEGGCDTLASALVQLLPAAKLYAVEKTKDPGVPQHYVVTAGGFFIDGDGASTRAELLERWRVFFVEMRDPAVELRLRPVTPSYVAKGRKFEYTECDLGQVRALTKALRTKLPPFPEVRRG